MNHTESSFTPFVLQVQQDGGLPQEERPGSEGGRPRHQGHGRRGGIPGGVEYVLG